MENKICNALANAAHFRAERGDVERAEELLRRAIRIAEHGGCYNDRFLSWVHLAHFLEDHNRAAEAEQAYRSAIDSVPLMHFDLCHAIALRELGELTTQLGRPEEGLALQIVALKIFDTLADEVALKSVATVMNRAS